MTEARTAIQCASCGADIAVSDGSTERCCRIERGCFRFSEDSERSEDYIKFGRYICQKCFLEDPDLCRFFNRIGCRVR